jgi:hypothetical protein
LQKSNDLNVLVYLMWVPDNTFDKNMASICWVSSTLRLVNQRMAMPIEFLAFSVHSPLTLARLEPTILFRCRCHDHCATLTSAKKSLLGDQHI